MEDMIGKEVGQYKIIGKLGEGGMATVYRASQESLEREIALKVLPPELTRNASFVERFFQEARSAAKMNHPNIVAIYEVGEADGIYYMAMPFIDGASMADILQQGNMTPELLMSIISQIAKALDYAHQRKIIHRDIKPGNIMVNKENLALLADFGIAKAMEQSGGLTKTGTMVGTPTYMAPEQAQGHPVTAQTDQYALGIVAYESITGKPPFDADTSHAILFQHVQTPPDLSIVPPQYQFALQRVLAKEPNQRFATVTEFAQALEGTISPQMAAYTPVPVHKNTPQPARTPMPNVAKKQGLPVWALAGIISFVVIAVVLGLFLLSPSNRQPDKAGLTITAEVVMNVASDSTKVAQSSSSESTKIAKLEAEREANKTVQAEIEVARAETDVARAETDVARANSVATQNALLAILAQPSSTSTPTDTPSPTSISTSTPIPIPTKTPTPTKTAVKPTTIPSVSLSRLSGRIAFPVDDGLAHYDIWVMDLPDGKPFVAIQGARQPSFFKKDGRLIANGEDNPNGLNNVILSNYYFDQIGLISDSPTDERPFWASGGDRVIYGNANLVTGRSGNSFLFIQCTMKRPEHESRNECKDIPRYGILSALNNEELIAESPVWTDDGSYIIFRRMSTGKNDGLSIIGSWGTPRDNGGGLQPQLLLSSSTALPSDTYGDIVYFFANDLDANWEVYSLNFRGGKAVNLSNNPSSDGLPTVSPDGKWLAFASDRDGKWAIWVMPAKGGIPKKLTDFPRVNPWGAGAHDWTTERMSWGP